MNEKIMTAIKSPEKPWCIGYVENTLEAFQTIVGGYIEHFAETESGVQFFCNEEGKLQGLQPNVVTVSGDVIVGTIFAVRSDEDGEFTGLTNEDINYLLSL